MNNFFYKLLLGRPEQNIALDHTALQNQKLNLKRVWNNEKHDDFGLEKILRLFLIAIQFIFPGIYIRDKYGRKGLTYKNLAIEAYVLLKLITPIIFLLTGIYLYKVCTWLTVYLLLETIFYISTLIFVSDVFAKPRSYRRSVLLLLINYLEIVFDFAVIYGGFDLLENANSFVDYVYFSFITSATVGYGDILPSSDFAKIMVSIQTVIFLIFIVLFLNFFSSRVESKQYFEKEPK